MFHLKAFLIPCICLSFLFCNNTDKNKELKNIFSLIAINPGNAGEMDARLFYVNSLIYSSSSSTAFIQDLSTITINKSKKKLVFIHGWDATDRDSNVAFSEEQLKQRITESWSEFFRTSDFYTITNSKSFDIYAFTYRTSNPIDTNGKRLRARLDTYFGDETGTVTIFSHSMGGLLSRFAVYESSKPGYLTKVITSGTPYHGSPWASSQYQQSKGFLGSVASYLTDTDGGRDLGWDNSNNAISGAGNSKLTTLNAKTDRDSLFIAYYGSLTNSPSAASDSNKYLLAGCTLLGATYSTSDCVVPSTSARLDGRFTEYNAGAYDHYDMKLVPSSLRTRFLSDLP